MHRETSAGAVVFRPCAPRLYLILHYEEGHWDFPKGHMEEGESEEETARREIREETGIEDIVFVDGFRGSLEYLYRRDGKSWHKDVVLFLATARTGQVRLSDEHIGYAWLPFEEALIRLTYENARNVLMEAESFLSKG